MIRYAGPAVRLTPPSDFVLARDVCSYGYFLLAPNHWDVASQSLTRALHLRGGPVACVVRQATPRGERAAAPGGALRITADRALDAGDRAELRGCLSRMLRLDESAEDLAGFFAADARWRDAGRGRLFRSPTLFEDVVKTVTSCNVAWPSTIGMNRRMCEVLGARTPSGLRCFPTAEKIARTRAGTLRARCGVGYRDQRLIDLARLFVRGEIDEAWLTSGATSDDEVFRLLLTLPGIGPYAAGNIMQLLGRYSRLALDSESVRHARTVLGMEGEERALMKRLAEHYAPFGAHRFRSYWFELWAFYEAKRGPAHLWDRETTGKTFTAALLAERGPQTKPNAAKAPASRGGAKKARKSPRATIAPIDLGE